MTTITPTALGVGGSSIKISNNNRPGGNQTYISVDRGPILGSLDGGRGYTALDQHEAYELIKAIGGTSGLLIGVGFSGNLTITKPAPKKTPEEIRRAELNNTAHSELLNTIIRLEKNAGKL